jgi:hypothetical protein
MATAYDQAHERRAIDVEAGGSVVEAVGGFGVIVLSILGLAGLIPDFLASIAGIVFGVAIFAEGAAIAAEYSSLYARLTGGAIGAVELGGGMTVEIMAGVAAIVLGILALIGVATTILLPALVIAAGAALMLTSWTLQRLNHLKLEAFGGAEVAQHVARGAVSGAAGAQLLAGLAAVVLGIIALVALPAGGAAGAGAAATAVAGTGMTLTLVGLLVLGFATLMSGVTLAGRFMQATGGTPPRGGGQA